jgi:hypothetical protein
VLQLNTRAFPMSRTGTPNAEQSRPALRTVADKWRPLAPRRSSRGRTRATAVKPADILEDIWVRDIVDPVWEALRLRRLKANLMTATAVHGLAELLEPFMGEYAAIDLARDWATRRPRAIKKVDSILASLGLTKDAVMAQTPRVCPRGERRSDQMRLQARTRGFGSGREIGRDDRAGSSIQSSSLTQIAKQLGKPRSKRPSR